MPGVRGVAALRLRSHRGRPFKRRDEATPQIKELRYYSLPVTRSPFHVDYVLTGPSKPRTFV